MASFWYLSLCCVILVLCLYHAVSSECDINVSKKLATIGSNGNLSVLCDTSCMVGDNRGDMVWYNNQFNQVSQSGRIFSVSYGRGRYSRLVILHAIPTDEGNYICTLETNGEIKQKSFTLIYDDPTLARSKQDIGPRRGDVVIYDPDILHPRPKREAINDGSGRMGDDEATTEPEPESESEQTTMIETSHEPVNETTTEAMMDSSSEPMTNTSPKPSSTSNKADTTLPLTPRSATSTTTRQKTTTPKTIRQTTTAQTTTTKQTDQGDAKPIEGGNSNIPNTEFGRSGLVAFVVSLSIALLLLYALVLILLIPMCLKRKKRRTSTKKRTQTTKDTPVVLSQIAKSEDNGDLPSPGPSDAGFTTIDLDDPPKDKQQDNAQQASEQKENDVVKGVPSATTDPETTSPQESMLSSMMLASDKGEGKPVDPAPVGDDLKFIDETTHSTESHKLDDSSVFDDSTPTVVGPTTETTEVKLEITEKEDGQKQIKLSSSSPPPETQSVSSQSSN